MRTDLPPPWLDDNMAAMNRLVIGSLATIVAAGVAASAVAQSPTPGTGESDNTTSFETLIKKLDEQNTKIDALSQQILKLEQQITAIRPGVIIGETTPPPTSTTTATSATTSSPAPSADNGNAHVVTKGETLTSIAKAHKVGVQDLQKFNHIENDRALQIGQTIMIPTSGAASPAAAPSASPNE